MNENNNENNNNRDDLLMNVINMFANLNLIDNNNLQDEEINDTICNDNMDEGYDSEDAETINGEDEEENTNAEINIRTERQINILNWNDWINQNPTVIPQQQEINDNVKI